MAQAQVAIHIYLQGVPLKRLHELLGEISTDCEQERLLIYIFRYCIVRKNNSV